MNSYDGNPVYYPKVQITETAEGMEGITQVKADRGPDSVTIRFQKDSGEDVITLAIPCYEKNGNAGFLGGDFAQSLLYAMEQSHEHIDGESIVNNEVCNKHLTATQRAWLAARMAEPTTAEFSFVNDTEIVPTSQDDAINNGTARPKSGDDLQTCIQKLMSAAISYWRHYYGTNTVIANIQTALGGKANASHTHNTNEVLVPNSTKTLTTRLTEIETTASQAVEAAKVETVVTTVDDLKWFVRKYKCGTETYCVATTHYDTDAISISTACGYNYAYPLNLDKTYPVTFKDSPDIGLVVNHLNSNTSGTYGIGVWAVTTNKSETPTTKLPMMRLQAASKISKLSLRVGIRVEGYI